MIPTATIEETERRYRARTGEREAAKDALKDGQLLAMEDPERLRRRLQRLAEKAASTLGTPTDAGMLVGFERFIGANDMLGAEFLVKGASVARAVCRVQIGGKDGVLEGYGTGFLVSPRLLMTNNHVLPDAATAGQSRAEFDYQALAGGGPVPSVLVDLDPGAFFATDPRLDYALVAVAPTGLDRAAAHGWIPLIGVEGKAVRGSHLNIVQHPDGQLKQVGLRENRLVDMLEDFLHYETDTSPGSSGAPVFNDEWEMVALHHSGVPRRDAQGQILDRDGGLWDPSMSDDLIDWIANEGVRVSRLVKNIAALALGPAQAALRDELLAASAGPELSAGPAGVLGGSGGGQAGTGPGGTITAGSGEAVLHLPLEIVFRLGSGAPAAAQPGTATPTAAAPASPHAAPAPSIPSEPNEVAGALAELARARREPYYDAAADAQAAAAFYAGLDLRAAPEPLRRALSELLEGTHEPRLSYKPQQHVYPRVDLQADGNLRSIYTGEEFRPEDFIVQDARAELERAARIDARLAHEAAPSAQERLQLETEFEALLPYNCEHVVPQSWFQKQEPMRGDLHHLFACQRQCNSFRGNFPYFDFTDFEEALREHCGKREQTQGFEPNEGKGAVARTTLYFLLRYPSEIDLGVARIDESWLQVVLAWHAANEVTDYERHRNAAIAAKQGNRNPLIDHPDLAGRIDWEAALGG